MRRFWSVLAVQLGKRAGLVSVLGLLITLILGMGIPKLEFATGQDSYLNKDDQVAIDNVAYQELFGGQLMIVLFTMDSGHTVAELASPANAAAISRMKAEIMKSPDVKAVISPVDTLQFSERLLSRTPEAPTDAKAFDPLRSIASTAIDEARNDPDQSARSKAIREADYQQTVKRILPFGITEKPPSTDPAWIDFLLHDNQGKIRKPLRSSFFDDRHAQMIVRLVGNASIEGEGHGAVAVKDAAAKTQLKGASIVVTGAPVLLKDINDYLRGGILRLGGLAVAIMIVILLVLFDVRWRLLPLAVVLLGVTWAFGLAGYLHIPLSIVTIAGLPVMLGVGIDYAIQMHARVEEEVIIDRAEHPIQETARNLCPALLVVTFDAVFAFAALRFARVPMLRDFGLLLCIGIAVICLTSIIVPLATLGIREYRSPTHGRDFREGALGSIVVWLGSVPARFGLPLVLISAVIFGGGIAVESKLVLQTDPVQWVNQESQNRKDVATLENRTGASSELGVYVTAKTERQLFTDRTMNWMDDFTDSSLKLYKDKLLVSSSVLSPLADLVDVPGTDNHTPSARLVKASYDAAQPSVRDFVVSTTSPAFNLLFVTRPADLQSRSVMVEDMRYRLAGSGPNAAEPPAGISATPSGLAVVGVGLLDNLEANRVGLTYLAILFVFLFLSFRLRSIVRALLSLVPVLIAVGAASLVAYTFSLKLSPMTAVGGPLVIAVCTEFTSLILLRFLEERERGLSPEAAAEITARRTGRAFIVSALTATVGVAVIATSSLPLLRGFGIIVAMNVVVALLSALVILPPVMIWAEKHGWVSRGLIDPEIIAHATKTTDERTPTPDLAGID